MDKRSKYSDRQAVKTHMRENLGNLPNRGGGQELYRTFPKLRLGNADRGGGGRIFFNITQPKNRIFMD